MYVIVQFTDTKEIKIAVTTNHFDAGYQYNLLSMEEGQQAFLFEVNDDSHSSLALDPEAFDFETLPGAKVLAVNGEPYTRHQMIEDEDVNNFIEEHFDREDVHIDLFELSESTGFSVEDLKTILVNIVNADEEFIDSLVEGRYDEIDLEWSDLYDGFDPDDLDKEEQSCTCEVGHIYNNLCCPVHGKKETGETFGI